MVIKLGELLGEIQAIFGASMDRCGEADTAQAGLNDVTMAQATGTG